MGRLEGTYLWTIQTCNLPSSPPVRLNQEVCSSFLSVQKEGKQKTTGKEMHIFYGKKTLLNTYVHFCHINIIGILDELGLTI